jgi:hypothetical protein
LLGKNRKARREYHAAKSTRKKIDPKVFINLSRESIKQSPEYFGQTVLKRNYETRLFQHYIKRGYWIDEKTSEKLIMGLVSEKPDKRNSDVNGDEREGNETHRGIG